MKQFSFSKIKGIALLLLFLCLGQVFCLSASAVNASAFPLPSVSGASSVYLYHYESDQVLYKHSGLKQVAPASTVKIMTGLLALDYLGERMGEFVTLTNEMVKGVEGFRIQLEPEMTVSIRDLLYGVICAGGNDAAQALSLICCGSVEKFVAQMNQKAKTLGCTDTRFTNPTGLDDSQMYTTLDDVIRISMAAIQNSDFLTIASTAQYVIATESKDLTLYNRNAMISSFSATGYQNRYVKGLNAGMTDRGGYCTVAYAEHGGNSFLCVVMGAIESDGVILSYDIANTLIHHVIESYSYQQILKKGDIICTQFVDYSLPKGTETQGRVDCVIDRDLFGFLPRDISEKDLTYKTYFHHPSLSAPLREGTVVGGVDICYGDTILASAKLLAKESVEANGILLALATMKEITLSRASLLFLFSFIILLGLYVLLFERRRIERIAPKKRSRR